MNVQLSSRSDAWRTPPYILELVREVLGTIDLDPATSEEANRIVGATHLITRKQNALSLPWPTRCSVYLNPPGGKIGGRSSVRLFWQRLMGYRNEGGAMTHAIFAMFSVEGLQTTQADSPAAMDFPICIPAKRIHWVDPTGDKRSSPSHSNAFVYVPGSIDATQRFIDVFSRLGLCKP